MQMVADAGRCRAPDRLQPLPVEGSARRRRVQRLAVRTQEAVRDLPADGSPRERIAAFIESFLDVFGHESPGAAVILGVSGIPEFDAKLAEVRTWRRDEITKIFRAGERDGMLRLPLKQAVALVFHMTAYVTWRSFVEESGLTPVAAKALACETVDAVLFGEEA